MNIKQLFCPSCGGTINGDLTNKETIFCPYCGQQLFIDREKKIIEITQNINKTEHIIDQARIVESNNQIKMNRQLFYIIIAIFLFCIIGAAFFSLLETFTN